MGGSFATEQQSTVSILERIPRYRESAFFGGSKHYLTVSSTDLLVHWVRYWTTSGVLNFKDAVLLISMDCFGSKTHQTLYNFYF